jgi:60 kDa SS-A/Ro ribonucleoprotein
VCRIGTHLLHFAQYVEGFRGWGRGLRSAVATWYGFTQRDLLRLAHPKAPDEPHTDPALRLIWAFEKVQRADSTREVIKLIGEYRLPREAVPTQWHTHAEALIRNLATLTRVGLLTPRSDATGRVLAQLADAERLRAARIHPIAVHAALKTYAQGQGERSKSTWEPVPQIKSADLADNRFHQSNPEPRGCAA